MFYRRTILILAAICLCSPSRAVPNPDEQRAQIGEVLKSARPSDDQAPVTMNRSLALRWPTVRAPGSRSASGPPPSSRDVPLDRWRTLVDEAFLQADNTRRLIEATRATSEHCEETVTTSIQRLRHSRELLATVAPHGYRAAIGKRRGELARE